MVLTCSVPFTSDRSLFLRAAVKERSSDASWKWEWGCTFRVSRMWPGFPPLRDGIMYKRLLFAVVLNNELVVNFYRDLASFRKSYQLAGELVLVLLKVGKIESGVTEEAVSEVLVLS